MTTFIHLAILFVAKMMDNALGTAKTILVQRNRCLLAGIALALSNYIYFCITRNIVTTDSNLAILVVSIASGVGCCLAVALNNRLSRERTFVNVIMSDDLDAMRDALHAKVRIEIDSGTASVPEISMQHGVFYGNTAGFQRDSRAVWRPTELIADVEPLYRAMREIAQLESFL